MLQPVNFADHLPAQLGKEYQDKGLLLPEVAQVRNPRLLHALRKHVEMPGNVVLEHHEVQ